MRKLLFEKGHFWTQMGFVGLDDEEFKKRTTAVQLAIFTALGGILYSIVYIALGFPSVIYVIYVYVFVCLLNLIYLRVSHNYAGFGAIQLTLILLFPIAAHLTIGGFIEASGVGIAVFLAPAGALLYAKRNIARICFYVFLIEITGAAVWEYYYGNEQPSLPRGIILSFFVIVFSAVCGIVYFLLESFLQKQEELRVELRQSLHNLRTTQAQLIQAEKMASLGQLTAGIAHEIQNPLNFVNNFTELNAELTQELIEELAKPVPDQQLIEELVKDLIYNQGKIVHHGKRATNIVKGMLEHSRTSIGKHQPTDINALVDEFLHLAYHGQRAKDNTFNVTLITDYGKDLPQIAVIPQDLGRVFLNLLNNAFYAVHKKTLSNSSHNYQPTVWVSTKKAGKFIRISIKDNGTGIPENVKSNIFQPFFTTKPTGEGTGLGLSLSYDIVTGAHGGAIEVESKVGDGTEFVVSLPENQ